MVEDTPRFTSAIQSPISNLSIGQSPRSYERLRLKIPKNEEKNVVEYCLNDIEH